MISAEAIAKALGEPIREGDGWRALCPCHDDQNPSLAIHERNGRILVHCRAGCAQESIVMALKKGKLWPEREIDAVYDYRDDQGAVRYQVVRYKPKAFRQRRPNGAGGFVWNMVGVEPLPYRLERILSRPRYEVFIVEGEKDVDALVNLGLVATCSHGGAGKWDKAISPYLAGRDVVILPDNDEAGRQHAEDVARKLAGVAERLRILCLPNLPPKGDVSDWIKLGGTRDELLRFADAAPGYQAPPELPELLIDDGDLPATVRKARDILARSGKLMERSTPVMVIRPADGGSPHAVPMTANKVVFLLHTLSRPVKMQGHKTARATFPDRAARIYLDLQGDWNLKPLSGITGAPILSDDGQIRASKGYDRQSGLWADGIPNLSVKARPSRQNAEDALDQLRHTFRTFPFADAKRVRDRRLNVDIVDLRETPGFDESAFLIALLTAACRPSLHLAPGLIIRAPGISGSGTGKGHLCRAISAIAFGTQPSAFQRGHDREEMDKRIVAELIGAAPVLFLDNVNAAALRSDTLASVLTERPAKVRVLGKSEMRTLNSTAFVCVTGNALAISEDLVRRFLVCDLDAKVENPETRRFAPGFLDRIMRRRQHLLTCALTIWRWGRQRDLRAGEALGSYEVWGKWCRDPLIALGCADPVLRLQDIKANDPTRREAAEFLAKWHDVHQDDWIITKQLDKSVVSVIDPDGKSSRQRTTAYIDRLADTRLAGFRLERRKGGRWSRTQFRVLNDGQQGKPERQ